MKFNRKKSYIEYEVEYIDRAFDMETDEMLDYEMFECVLKVNKKEYLINFDYDIKEKSICSYCVMNQVEIGKEETDNGFMYFSLLEYEIKEVAKFMLGLF